MAHAPYAFVEDQPHLALLDRADHLRDDASALSALWPRARVILLDADGQALADEQRRLCAPRGEQLSGGPGGVGAAVFLGRDGEGEAWFALDAELTAFQAPGRSDLRGAAMHWPRLPCPRSIVRCSSPRLRPRRCAS